MSIRPEFHADTARVSWKRSAIKTVTYRVVSWASTTATAWAIISSGWFGWETAAVAVAAFGTIDAIANSVLYYVFERLWAHIDLNISRRNGRKSTPALETFL